MNETNSIFMHPKTLDWIAYLSGRYTFGSGHGSPSRYFGGDFSLPHADYAEHRTVAYVWHLTRPGWQRAWGGALYWCGEPENGFAYQHASYNTLNLFSVTRYTQHFVTMVSPYVPEPEYKRLTWNGWWQDDRAFTWSDPVDTLFDTYEKRLHLTAAQIQSLMTDSDIEDFVDDDERLETLQQWRDVYWHEENSPRQNSLLVDLYGRQKHEDEMHHPSYEGYDIDEDDDVGDVDTSDLSSHYHLNRNEYGEDTSVLG